MKGCRSARRIKCCRRFLGRTYMNEFVSAIRHRAAEALRTEFRQEATPGTDPIVELIGFLLDEAIGSDSLPANLTLSPEQWTTWNELVLLYEVDVIQAMSNVLNRER